MKVFKILIPLSVLALLCSCNAQKHWTERGLRNHWLDTTTKVKTGSVQIDTVEISADVDTFFQYMDRDVYHPCDEQGKITPEAKKQMATKAKKELVPPIAKAILVPMRNINLEGGGQLSFWYDSTKAQIDYILTLPGQRLICPEPSFKEACAKVWWIIPTAFFGGILAFILFLYLITRLKR